MYVPLPLAALPLNTSQTTWLVQINSKQLKLQISLEPDLDLQKESQKKKAAAASGSAGGLGMMKALNLGLGIKVEDVKAKSEYAKKMQELKGLSEGDKIIALKKMVSEQQLNNK